MEWHKKLSKAVDILPYPRRRSFQTVPNGDEGKPTEKTQRSSKLGQQGGEGVEEHLVSDSDKEEAAGFDGNVKGGTL